MVLDYGVRFIGCNSEKPENFRVTFLHALAELSHAIAMLGCKSCFNDSMHKTALQ